MMSKPIHDFVQAAVFDLPCVYANRMNVIVGDDGMARLTFGESSGPEAIVWNTSVALTNANLEALYDTIGAVLSRAVQKPERMQ